MQNLICFSAVRWNYLFQRPQQLMSRFARDFRVAYVNPPRMTPEEMTPSEVVKKYSYRLNPNLTVLSPHRPKSIKGPQARDFFLNLMGEFIRTRGFYDPILWFNMPEASYLCGQLGEKMVVYDCLDDMGSFSWTPEFSTYADRSLTRQADLILTVSEPLFQSKQGLNRKVFLVPNGCDFEHFQQAMDPNLPVPPALQSIKNPRLGFVGALYEWVDFDLLEAIARRKPHWSVVLVGPRQTGVKIPKLPNIYRLGRQSYQELPAFIGSFDICIIPFKTSATGASSNPVKLYEYMAAGKPILSADLPEAAKFGRAVTVAKDPVQFIEKTEQLLAEDPADASSRRGFQLSIARANTWDGRYETVKKILEQYQRPRGRPL